MRRPSADSGHTCVCGFPRAPGFAPPFPFPFPRASVRAPEFDWELASMFRCSVIVVFVFVLALVPGFVRLTAGAPVRGLFACVRVVDIAGWGWGWGWGWCCG